MIKIRVAGKINLLLNVFDVIEGFHKLDMVTASVNIFDDVTLSISNKTECNLENLIDPKKNAAYIAAELFSECFGTPKVKIEIEKRIPLMAGLGGSSANGAAVIFGMGKLFGIDDLDALKTLARKVGSDVPSMLVGGFLRVRGTGELVDLINSQAKYHIIALKNGKGNSSREVYDRFDKMKIEEKYDTEGLIFALSSGDKSLAIKKMGNALTLPALSINDKMSDVFGICESLSPDKVIVFGSGSTVGAVFMDENRAKKAFASIKERRLGLEFAELLTTTEKGIFAV